MIKIIFRLIFENIFFLHLHQNKCQNIGTPPLPSYRATPTLLEGTPTLTSDTMVLSRGVGVALLESRGAL